MPDPHARPDASDPDWCADWDAHERRQRERLRQTTADQRLAWLEEALAFAAAVGALPRRRGEDASDA